MRWILIVMLVASPAFAQDQADQWYTISNWGGLQLFLSETNLPPGQALEAQNVQFSKVGTISMLEGLRIWDYPAAWNFGGSAISYPCQGFGFILDNVLDSDRVVAAINYRLYNTYGNDQTFIASSAEQIPGEWLMARDSTRVYDTMWTDRAAFYWRPGWEIETATNPPGGTFDTIKSIWDNHLIFLNSAPGASAVSVDSIRNMSQRVHPLLSSRDKRVKWVDVSVGATPMKLALQAGQEPLLYTGESLDGVRWFGVADSGEGYVQNVYASGQAGEAYITANSLGAFYAKNQMAESGYWLQIAGPWGAPGGATDIHDPLDSSFAGKYWRIDSNVNVEVTAPFTSGSGWEHRIYFTVHDSNTYSPGGGAGGVDPWKSYQRRPFQILSTPIIHQLYSRSQTNTAEMYQGGRKFRVPSGNIDPDLVNARPCIIEVDADSLFRVWTGPEIHCKNQVCETTYITIKTPILSSDFFATGLVRDVNSAWTDTAGTDTTVIMCQGSIKQFGLPMAQVDAYSLWNPGLPYASDGRMYLDRLFLGGDPTSPNTICFSHKDERGARIGAFPDENIMQLPSNGDVFTGFAQIYDWLIVFQERHTFALKGDPEGGANDFECLMSDEGCMAPGSIVELNNRVIYLSHKGWRVFDGNNSSDFAEPILPAVQGYPRATHKVNQGYKSKSVAAYDPNTGNVWMCMPFGTDTVNSGSFIWNDKAQTFTFSDEVYGAQVCSVPYLDTTRLVFAAAKGDTVNRLFEYRFPDSTDVLGVDGTYMTATYKSGWLDFGAPEQKKFMSDGVIYAKLAAPVTISNFRTFQVKVYKDFDTTAYYTETANVWGRISSKHYEQLMAIRLEDPTEFEFLRLEFIGNGLSVMDIQRASFRWNFGSDVVRDAAHLRRPDQN